MDNITTINTSQLKKTDYNGSVQNLYFLKEPDGYMVCETTSGGSVFDVGTIFSIEGSDISRAAIRHKIYSLLSDPVQWKALCSELSNKPNTDKILLEYINSNLAKRFQSEGAKTHHIGLVDEYSGVVYQRGQFPEKLSKYVLVKRYNVIKPRLVKYMSNNLWDYSEYFNKDGSLIPLENIVRFGLTPSSSVLKKYLKMRDKEKSTFLLELGLSKELTAWERFNVPTVDFTTKYEPEDRNLSLQEALYITGFKGEQFFNIMNMAILGSLMVSRFFEEIGLFLWDIKWELAIDNGELVFVDTIDTDSVRVTTQIEYKGSQYHVHFNKQSMRDYYAIKHPDWYKAVNDTKAKAKDIGVSFTEILKDGQIKGIYPATPVVDKGFLEIQKAKQETIVSYIVGRISGEQTREKINKIGLEELEYYQRTGGLDKISALNIR
jgi:phosphoribosylaminoimidazole-succinocarboxamide synthase